MEKFRLHFLENEIVKAVFFCDTLGIYALNASEMELLRQMNHGQDVPNTEETSKLLAILQKEQETLQNMQSKNCDVNPFYTLILNVSNSCNMECAYCFANHGTYHSENGVMRPETAICAIDKVYAQCGFIGEIKFFGGEPMLALPVMEAVCSHVTELKATGKIQAVPEFRVISNGTVMTEQIAEWIQKYHVQYVISMDGFPELHDSARKMKNGDGSYAKIIENIAFFNQKTGSSPSGIEITYHAEHETRNTELLSVIKHLEQVTGVDASRINLSPVMLKTENPFSIQNMNYVLVDYLDEIMDEIRNTGKNHADKKFRGLVSILRRRMRSGNQICEAGTGCIAVSAHGTIYPCLMFIDENEFAMGEIQDNLAECMNKFQEKLPALTRLKRQPCMNCPVNRVCRQCMGVNRFQTGKIETPDIHQCGFIRKRIDKAILGIAEELF